MSESASHRKLVASLVAWAAQTYLDGDAGSILVDSSVSREGARPPSIHGYIPDVFIGSCGKCDLLIGEAKTARDLENRHTRAQLTAFLRRCALEPKSTFVMAVPWQMERFARSLIHVLQQRNGVGAVRAVVLEKLGS